MQNITKNGYDEMSRYVEGMNNDLEDAGKRARLAILEAYATGKKVGEMRLEADCADNDGGRRREGDAGSGDKNQP